MQTTKSMPQSARSLTCASEQAYGLRKYVPMFRRLRFILVFISVAPFWVVWTVRQETANVIARQQMTVIDNRCLMCIVFSFFESDKSDENDGSDRATP